jgi:hypothetical protein
MKTRLIPLLAMVVMIAGGCKEPPNPHREALIAKLALLESHARLERDIDKTRTLITAIAADVLQCPEKYDREMGWLTTAIDGIESVRRMRLRWVGKGLGDPLDPKYAKAEKGTKEAERYEYYTTGVEMAWSSISDGAAYFRNKVTEIQQGKVKASS